MKTSLAPQLEPGQLREAPRAALNKRMANFDPALGAHSNFCFKFFDKGNIFYLNVRHTSSQNYLSDDPTYRKRGNPRAYPYDETLT